MMECVDPETGEAYLPEPRICGHCQQEMRGFADMGGTWLCHPDEGLDCYRLVTVYKHPMPHPDCSGDLAAVVTEPWFVDDEDDLFPPLPFHCEKCDHLLNGEGSTYGVCRAGNCATVLCGGCGKEWASFGPVGCECQSRHPRLRKIRAMYARRKR